MSFVHSGYLRKQINYTEYCLFQDKNYITWPTSLYTFTKRPQVATAKLSNSEAVGSRDLVNTQDTANCEAVSDVCYLSSVKAYILVALSFTR